MAQKLEAGSMSAMNHALASSVEAERTSFAQRIYCPTLILHGTQDRAFPQDHALNSARLIPNAKITWLDGVGHMPNVNEFIQLADYIVEHLQRC